MQAGEPPEVKPGYQRAAAVVRYRRTAGCAVATGRAMTQGNVNQADGQTYGCELHDMYHTQVRAAPNSVAGSWLPLAEAQGRRLKIASSD